MNHMNAATNGSDFWGDVEGGLQRTLGDGDVLGDASRYLCLAQGAKRLRPRLVQLWGEGFGLDPRRLVDLAVAAELIHTASLLHDDVVDEGRIRRGRATVNVQWGNTVAVLAGDYLLSRAFLSLQAYPQAVTSYAVDLIGQMAHAAVREVEARGRPELTVPQWRDIALGKTGAILSFCARAVALIARRPERVERMAAFGDRLGVAFQMADDLRDLLDPALGKDRWADVRNRNPSFALAFASEQDADVRLVLGRLWQSGSPTSSEVQRVAKRIIQSPCVPLMLEAFDAEVAGVADVNDSVPAEWVEALLGPLPWRSAQ